MAGHLELIASNAVAGVKADGGKFLPRHARRFRTFMSCVMRESSTLEGEIEVEIIYSVSPGCAPSHDDPGSPPEVTVHALRTAMHAPHIDLTWMGTTWIEEDEEMVAALVADWTEAEIAAADDAAEMRAEDRRNGD